MYADGYICPVILKKTSIYITDKKLTMEKIADWLHQSCLPLNRSKTEAIFFSVEKSEKYLGVIIDSNLTLKNILDISLVKSNISLSTLN